MARIRQSFILVLGLLFLMVLLTGCGGGGIGGNSDLPNGDATPLTPGTITAVPNDASAIPAAKTELAYLAALTERNAQGVISGQNCGHGNEIALGNYNTLIETLHQQTGQYVGMLGIDYEYMREFTLNELKSANAILKDHWNHGGWVTINWSPENPWGTTFDYNTIRTKYSGADMRLLYQEGNAYYTQWHQRLDIIAQALDDLQQAGVVVLWRPMQEPNGWWFWWGKDSQSTIDPNPYYAALWQDMYNYFTNVKGLHNLLWVFSPNKSQSFAGFPYPGDQYVDVVGGTQYDNNLVIPGYNDYLAYHKPIGMAECGPDETTSVAANGTFDDRLYVNRFKNTYPRVAYWVTWHSWTGVKMAIVDCKNASACLNDPYIINRGARN